MPLAVNRTGRWSASKRVLLAALTLVVIALMSWLAVRGNFEFGSASISNADRGLAVLEQTHQEPGDLSAADEGDISVTESSRPLAVERAKIETPHVVVAPQYQPLRHTLLLELRLPDGSKPKDLEGIVRLRSDKGEMRQMDLRQRTFAEFLRMSPEVWRSSIEAPGFRHWPQTIDMTSLARKGPANEWGASRITDVLYLWPKGLIPVRVSMQGGDWIDVLIESLGFRASRSASSLLALRFQSQAPRTGQSSPEHDPDLARFEPGQQGSLELADGKYIGILERVCAETFCVCLMYDHNILAWKEFAPNQEELIFELDASSLRARRTSVSLRVVAKETGQPLTDPVLVLHKFSCEFDSKEAAGTGACSCGDRYLARSLGDGIFAFANVRPNWYELQIARGAASYTFPVQVFWGKPIDLGEFAIPAQFASLQIEVVDESGQPVAAELEVAPYHSGSRLGEIFPPKDRPMIRIGHEYESERSQRHYYVANLDGPPLVVDLPLQKCLVRVHSLAGTAPLEQAFLVPQSQLAKGASALNSSFAAPQLQFTNATAIYLLDPDHPPASPWRLTLRARRKVSIQAPPGTGSKIQVLDEYDLIRYSERIPKRAPPARLELIPGHYRCQLVDDAGALVRERAFDVSSADVALVL